LCHNLWRKMSTHDSTICAPNPTDLGHCDKLCTAYMVEWNTQNWNKVLNLCARVCHSLIKGVLVFIQLSKYIWREVLFFAKKKYFFLPKKRTSFCKKKYLFLVIKTHFMPSNALLWEPQSHHQGRLSGLLSSPIKQMTPQTTRVPSPPSQ